MTIYIAPGWIILSCYAIELVVLLLIYYKFLLSDFFYEKTEHKLHYIKENGSRDVVDSVTIFVSLIFFYVIFVFNSYVIYLFTENYYILYGSLIACGVETYASIIIYLRIKFFYYDGDKYESEKRYPTSYPIFSFKWTTIISFFSTLMFGIYYVTHRHVIVYCLIVLFFTFHMLLIPDYLNKIFPADVRTDEGRSLIVCILWAICTIITLISCGS